MEHTDTYSESKSKDWLINSDEDKGRFLAPVKPDRYSYNTNNAPFVPHRLPPVGDGGFVNTPNGRDSVAMWAGGFASTAAIPRTGTRALPAMPMIPGAGSNQVPPNLDYGGYGGFGNQNNLQRQP
jgi:hypothetical protein